MSFILDLVGYDEARDLATYRLVEPACGDGAFLGEIASRIITSCLQHGRPLTDATDAVRAYDLRQANVSAARATVVQRFVEAGLTNEAALEVADAWVVQADFLLADWEPESVDFVVGNPPYIRPEEVPKERMNLYRAACHTMTGRADVYVGFFEVGLGLLRKEGTLGFICADRWMRNAYGRRLRDLVVSEFAVDATIEMHDVDAFADDVSAYPAITIIRRAKQEAAVVVVAQAGFEEGEALDLATWMQSSPHVGAVTSLPSGTEAAVLSGWFDVGASWPSGSPERLALLRTLESRFRPLESGTTRAKGSASPVTRPPAIARRATRRDRCARSDPSPRLREK